MSYTPAVVWEFVFMMVILKIPIVYLCLVIWWAVKAESSPAEGAAGAGPDGPGPRPVWSRRSHRPRPRRGGPHGSPARSYARARGAFSRVELRR